MAMAAGEGEWGWMAEVAGEELAKLEAVHPGRFGPLKVELKRLIADPTWDNAAAAPLASPDGAATTTTTTASSSSQSAPILCIISTQESSSRKRSWGCNGDGDGDGREREQDGKRRGRRSAAPAGKDRAAMAIERAERCLKRIRAFKASLLGFSD